MNFLLDRFPAATFFDMQCALENRGDSVPLAVLTIQSKQMYIKTKATIFYDRDIARGRVTRDLPMELERAEFNEASQFEGLAINVFSRFSIGQNSFSAQEMSSHYFELYNFWVYQLKRHKIEFCLQHYLPHDPSSFVLYLALKCKKIPVIFVDAPHIFNKYRALSCSYRNRNILLRSCDEVNELPFNAAARKYQYELHLKSSESIPKVIRYRYAKKQHNFLVRILIKISAAIKSPETAIRFVSNFFVPTNDLFKTSRYSWRSKLSEFSGFRYYIFMKKLALGLSVRKKMYERECVSVLPGKYVYFAMSAQPEGTTLPAALEFRDVFTVIRSLRQAIPADVPILYKENPAVFETRNPYLSAVRFRSPDFYHQLSLVPNLQFVSTGADSHELIRNATLVATINGTAATEAVFLDVPAVTFGSNWYDDLEGIHKFRSVNDLKEFYKLVDVVGYKPKPLESPISLDKTMLIEFEDHNPYEFQGGARQQLVAALLAAVDKFQQLDDRKWSI